MSNRWKGAKNLPSVRHCDPAIRGARAYGVPRTKDAERAASYAATNGLLTWGDVTVEALARTLDAHNDDQRAAPLEHLADAVARWRGELALRVWAREQVQAMAIHDAHSEVDPFDGDNVRAVLEGWHADRELSGIPREAIDALGLDVAAEVYIEARSVCR